MHPAYFEVRFRLDQEPRRWPDQFAIVSAWATTGQRWPLAKNLAADRELAEVLAARCLWCHRITGYSPTTGHAEPGWAFTMAFDPACDLGLQFEQDAIYWIDHDQLSVTHCDARRTLIPVSSFRGRLDL